MREGGEGRGGGQGVEVICCDYVELFLRRFF